MKKEERYKSEDMRDNGGTSHDEAWLETFLQLFYRSTLITVLICRRDELLLTYAPTMLPREPALIYLMPFLLQSITSPVYVARHGFLFGAVPIPSMDRNILIGPLTETPADLERCQQIQADIGPDQISAGDLRYRINKSPLISKARFLSILRFLQFSLTGTNSLPSEVLPKPVDEADTIFQLRHGDQPELHRTQEIEQKILSLIEAGNVTALVAALQDVYNNGAYSTGIGFVGSLDQARAIFITSGALCSRAAIRGGMDYEKALTRMDDYLRQVLTINNPDDIMPFLGMMMVDYARQVAALEAPADASPVTTAAIRRILSDIRDPLSVASLAEQLGFSASYLSHTFRRDMGMDIKSYILQAKIEEAQRLLLQNKTIREVAEELSFSSTSHFQTVFKKVTGMTPRGFKNKGSL